MNESAITNTFIWTIPALDVEPSKNGLANVVKTIHWRYRIISSDDMSEEIYGTVGLGDPESTTFVSYELITQSLVEQWLAGAVNVKEMQDNMVAMVQNRRTPQIVTQSPPCAS